MALPCCIWNRYAVIRVTEHWDEEGNCIVTENSLPDHHNYPLPPKHFRLLSVKFLRLKNIGNDLQVTEVVWLDFQGSLSANMIKSMHMSSLDYGMQEYTGKFRKGTEEIKAKEAAEGK